MENPTFIRRLPYLGKGHITMHFCPLHSNIPAILSGSYLKTLCLSILCVLVVIVGHAQTISGFSPTSGGAGTTVNITGTGFINVTQVTFNGVNSAFFVGSATSITAQVPSGASTGKIGVVTQGGSVLSVADFVVTASVPSITSFSPTTGAARTNVSISGLNFNNVDSVTFNGVRSLNMIVNSSINIQAEVPVGATTGPIRVHTVLGTAVSTGNFIVTGNAAITVAGFNPARGNAGTVVTFTGQNLDAISSVRLNALNCQIQNVTPTSLQVVIPTGATTGRFTLRTRFGTDISPVNTFLVVNFGGFCLNTNAYRFLTITNNWASSTVTGNFSDLYGFAGTAGTQYIFGTCTRNIDTEIYIHDSLGSVMASNTDNGPLCAGSAASLIWTAPTSNNYYVTVTGPGCTFVSASTLLNFKSGALTEVPQVLNFTPKEASVGESVVVQGQALNFVTAIRLGAVTMPLSQRTASSITLTVPASAATNTLRIEYAQGFYFTDSVLTIVPRCIDRSQVIGRIVPTLQRNSFTFSPAASAQGVKMFLRATERVQLSTCGATTNTRIRVYDSRGTTVADFEDNGPLCTGAAASGIFTPTQTDEYTVVVTNGTCGSVADVTDLFFEYDQDPTISSFAPGAVSVGAEVTITGILLDWVSEVRINGVVQQIVNRTNRNLRIKLTPGTTTGFIEIIHATGTALSALPLTVQPSLLLSPVCGTVPTYANELFFFSSPSTINVFAGSTYYWLLNATTDQEYSFSTCASNLDTKLRLFDSTGVEILAVDDDGPLCVSKSASMLFTPQRSGRYYLFLSLADCQPLPSTVGFTRFARSIRPQFNSFSPVSGPPGTVVTLNGTNLDRLDNLRLGNVPVQILTTNGATQLTFVVPQNAFTSNINSTFQGSLVSTGSFFNVTGGSTTGPQFCASNSRNAGDIVPVPTRTNVTIPAGPPLYYRFWGQQGVNYFFSTCGAGFDSFLRIYTEGPNPIALNDDNGPLCSSGAASMIFVAPASRFYYVHMAQYTCANIPSSFTFGYYSSAPTVKPIITSLTPDSGAVGTSVVAAGTNLTLADSVFIGRIPVQNLVRTSNTSLTFTVASGTVTDSVFVYSAGQYMNTGLVFRVLLPSVVGCAAPTRLDTLVPTAVQQRLTLDSGTVAGVIFDAVASSEYSWSTCASPDSTHDTEIRIYNVFTGQLVATADDSGIACASNKASIAFKPAADGRYLLTLQRKNCLPLDTVTLLDYSVRSYAIQVASVAPNPTMVADTLTISGRGFGITPTVSFNNGSLAAGQVLASTDSTITIVVPTGTNTGTVCVSNGFATACSQPLVIRPFPLVCATVPQFLGTVVPTTTWQTVSVNAGKAGIVRVRVKPQTTYHFSTCASSGLNPTAITIYDRNSTLKAQNNGNGVLCTGMKASLEFENQQDSILFVQFSDTNCAATTAFTQMRYKELSVRPIITRFTPTSGGAGTLVRVFGRNFSEVLGARLGSIDGVNFQRINDTTLSFAVGAGSETNRIELVSLTHRNVFSNTIFRINVGCNLNMSIVPGTITGRFSISIPNAVAPVTYRLNGITVSGTANTNLINVSTAGSYVLSATDSRGCSVSRSFYFSTTRIDCGSRFTLPTADTLAFFALEPSQSLGVIFERGTPSWAGIYLIGLLRATTSAANPHSLSAVLGVAPNVLEVRTSPGSTWSGYAYCQDLTTPTVVVTHNQSSETCGSSIVHMGFPNTSTYARNDSVVQVLRPTVGNKVRLSFLTGRLVTGQKLRIFDGDTVGGTPIWTFEGEHIASVPEFITAASTGGALTLVYTSKSSSVAAPGFYFHSSCVTNPNPSISTPIVPNPGACLPATLDYAGVILRDNSRPKVVQFQMSSVSDNFANPIVLAEDTVLATRFSGRVNIPNTVVPGQYLFRFKSLNSDLASGIVSSRLDVLPASSFIHRNDTLFAFPSGPQYQYQWSLNNSILQGFTQSFLRINRSGVYTVRITAGLCIASAPARTITNISAPVGTDFTLYPNPAQGQLTIEGWQGGAARVIMYNALGQRVLEMPLSTENRTTVPLNGIPAGSYYVEVGGVRKRVVVQ